MPVAALSHASIGFLGGLLDEIKDFGGGCAGSKHGSNARFVQRRAVFERNDATAKDDDIVQPRLNQLLAHLGEQVSVSTRKGGEAEEPGVFVSNGVDDLL